MVGTNEMAAEIIAMANQKRRRDKFDHHIDALAVPIYSVFKLQLRNLHAYRRIVPILQGFLSEVSAIADNAHTFSDDPDEAEAWALHRIHLKIREFNTQISNVERMGDQYPILTQFRGRGKPDSHGR